MTSSHAVARLVGELQLNLRVAGYRYCLLCADGDASWLLGDEIDLCVRCFGC